MSINVVARKLLWGRSGNRCAFPGCGQALTVDLGDPESGILAASGVILGEEAHIRSAQPTGPRYDAEYPGGQIDAYPNLILLCPTHHTLIDKNGADDFSVESLERMRREHEEKVAASDAPSDAAARALEERLVAAVAYWESQVADIWESLTAGLNHPVPGLSSDSLEQLSTLARWLLAKDWPIGYPKIRMAFGRFNEVLGLLMELVHGHFEGVDRTSWLELERPHKRLGRWDSPLYRELLTELQVNQAMTWFLTTELTRAANLVIHAVREELDPLYRFQEGVLLMRDGDGIIVSQIVRVEYSEFDWDKPLPELSLRGITDRIQAIAQEKHITPDMVGPHAVYDI